MRVASVENWAARIRAPLTHWRLRSKLVAALMVPVLLALALGSLRISDLATEAQEFDRAARFARVQGTVADLVERVGEERYRAVAFITGRVDERALRTTQGEVDRAIAATAAEVAALFPDDPRLVDAERATGTALATLGGTRQAVTPAGPGIAEVLTRYSDLVDRVDELEAAVLRGVTTPQAGGLALALERLSAVRNEVGLQYALVTAGSAVPDQPLRLAGSEARLLAGITEFRAALGPEQRATLDDAGAQLETPARTRLLGTAVAAGTPETGQNVRVIFDAALFRVDDTQRAVRAELTAVSGQTRDDAMAQAALNAVVLGLAVLVGVTFIALITRTMVRSLNLLRRSAMDIAYRTLPEAVHALEERRATRITVEPVPVLSREEIGEVARSFDAVHTQAVRLAEEQAMLQTDVSNMFTNLSRRSQSLIDHQLLLIDELQRTEPDRTRLVQLSRLDHLATRMRRNSENLLVLGGTDMSKRATHRVALADILGAAVAEVEQAHRIAVRPPPLVTIAGRVAGDLQHLLSELLDNSVSFSPPDSQILVTSFQPPGRPLYIDVCDAGVGMKPEEMADANRVLRQRSDIGAGADAARRMGFFVVGRLAERHQIDVCLMVGYAHETPDGRGPAAPPGLTVRVTVPPDRFAPEDRPAPRRHLHGPSGMAAITTSG